MCPRARQCSVKILKTPCSPSERCLRFHTPAVGISTALGKKRARPVSGVFPRSHIKQCNTSPKRVEDVWLPCLSMDVRVTDLKVRYEQSTSHIPSSPATMVSSRRHDFGTVGKRTYSCEGRNATQICYRYHGADVCMGTRDHCAFAKHNLPPSR
jgi:hypothetical protein